MASVDRGCKQDMGGVEAAATSSYEDPWANFLPQSRAL